MSTNASKSQLETILLNGDSSIIQSIPYKKLITSGVSTSSISPADLPPALVLNKGASLLASSVVNLITDTNSLIQAAKALTTTDINKVPAAYVISTSINLLTASNSLNSTGSLTRTQKNALLNSVLNYLSTLNQSQSPSSYLGLLSSSDAASLAELFIEAK